MRMVIWVTLSSDSVFRQGRIVKFKTCGGVRGLKER